MNRSRATTLKSKLNKPTTSSKARTNKRHAINKVQRRKVSTSTATIIPRRQSSVFVSETTSTVSNNHRVGPTLLDMTKSTQTTNTNHFYTNQPHQRRQFSTIPTTSFLLPQPTATPAPRHSFINVPKSSQLAIAATATTTATTTTHPIMKFSRLFSTTTQPESLDITYIEPSGDVVPLRIKTKDHADDSLMTLAVKNQVDMEGSCDGQLACSTCHCILSQDDYDAFMKLKPPTDEELDMLDTAFGLTPTSRLGCQIPINMLSKNITLTLPKFTR